MPKKIDARPVPGALFEEALTQFEEAVADMAWSGAQPPGERASLMETYLAKRKALMDYAIALETKQCGD